MLQRIACKRRAWVAPVALDCAFTATGNVRIFLVRVESAADHIGDIALEIGFLKLGMDMDGAYLVPRSIRCGLNAYVLAISDGIAIVDLKRRMKVQNLPEQLAVAGRIVDLQCAEGAAGLGIAGQRTGNRDRSVTAINQQYEILLDKCAPTDITHLFKLSVDDLIVSVGFALFGGMVLSEVFVAVHVLDAVSNTFNDFVATPCHVLSWVLIVLNG
ncbi:hypothetical protein N878_05545 [Pseudomonas sp. EGD-AK9]|nr:hypothetical protein N878_05545 [Pseudomonas sp. EGD-AK9]